MAALERMPPQLEAPGPVGDASEGVSPHPATVGAQEAAQPRPRTPWWRRVLGR
jgi:hypothetical protein